MAETEICSSVGKPLKGGKAEFWLALPLPLPATVETNYRVAVAGCVCLEGCFASAFSTTPTSTWFTGMIAGGRS